MFRIRNTFKCFITLLIISILLTASITVLYDKFLNQKLQHSEETMKNKNLSCHYSKNQDGLITIDETTAFPKNSVFFIDSSCKGLTSRHACSIESAARLNLDRQINILFTSPVSKIMLENPPLSTLLNWANINVARINLETYADDTSLYKTLKRPILYEDMRLNVSDIVKFLTLYKYSGIYLALDVILTTSLDNFKNNFIVKESPAVISSDIFSFSDNIHGRELAYVAYNFLHEFLTMQNFFNHDFDNNTIMNRIISLWCQTRHCLTKDLQIVVPERMHPKSIKDKQPFYREGDWDKREEQTLLQHLKYSFTFKNRHPLYVKIAEKYCPTIYNLYKNTFGII